LWESCWKNKTGKVFVKKHRPEQRQAGIPRFFDAILLQNTARYAVSISTVLVFACRFGAVAVFRL
jgi:hypothetical protein